MPTSAAKPTVRVVHQYREARNMTYEIACLDRHIIIRMFPLTEDDDTEWRIEARVNDGPDAVVASARAATRSSAFDGVATWWRENAVARGLAPFDWDAIATALNAVRAL